MAVKQTAGRDSLGEFAPKFAELNDDVLFGQVWSREDKLSLRDRSLLTVTALMSQGLVDSSFEYHLMTAKNNGITKTEIAEILTHLAFYAGWPKAWAAFRMAKEVWGDDADGKEAADEKSAYEKSLLFPVGEPNDAFKQYFIGQSYLAPVSKEQVGIYNVTFEPGCRNNWHIHHAKKGGGQILICIGGRGVAHGYLNDEERTKKQFFNHEKLGHIYRTGDLGLLSPKGYVIFLGRKDFQVKLYGYRIELGEIESCLCRCENVSEAVATVKEVNGVQKLFAYVTPMSVPGTGAVSDVQSTGGTDTPIRVFTAEGNEKFILPREDTNHAYPNMTEMYTALNSRVMDYMIPDDIIIMESLPYTANKKVNRKNLPVVNMVQAEDEVYEAPETETETMLAALIGEMIGNENVSVGANLINSGIDSLKGITLNTKLHDRGINIGLSEIYANPTIRQLGKLIDESGNGNEDIEFGEI